MIHIWMESLFDKKANPSGPTSKYVRNQWESSKQFTVQNLSGRCVAVLLADWPCIMSGLKPKLWAPNPWSFPTLGRVLDYKHSHRHCYTFGFCLEFSFPSRNRIVHCNYGDKSFYSDLGPQFLISSTVSISPLEPTSSTLY
jgi:hypothetical protein